MTVRGHPKVLYCAKGAVYECWWGGQADLSAVAERANNGGVVEEECPGEGLALRAQGGAMLQRHIQGMDGILWNLAASATAPAIIRKAKHQVHEDGEASKQATFEHLAFRQESFVCGRCLALCLHRASGPDFIAKSTS